MDLVFVISLAGILLVFGILFWILTGRKLWLRQWWCAYKVNPLVRLFGGDEANPPCVVRYGRVMMRIIGVACALIGATILVSLWGLHFKPFRGESFEVEAWREAVSCNAMSDWECEEKFSTCPRGKMVSDLISNHIEEGKTQRSEMFSLVGEPDYPINIEGRICAGFRLGMCSGLGLDYDSLFVCFDGAGVVDAAGHIQH